MALAIVAGIHVLLGLAFWQLKLATPEQRRDLVQSITLRLLPLPAEPRPPSKRDPLERETERKLAQSLQPREKLKPLEVPEPVSILVAPAPAEPIAQAMPQGNYKIGLDGRAVAAPGLPASGPSGLNLAPSREVLRGALANPATSDPRSNSPKPTVEERIAMSLDPELCLLAERMPDGSTRRRMSRWRRVQSTMSAVHAQGQGQARICE